ncbi:MAG: hypothetical protein B6A08_10040 [Sorangiineae bacterium NIC37A_2]|jgi:protein SCO1/2|nr:MAG: hypothetical protein B6A08_10040 [Sorangiineae bacterium NIC37A_2]
MLFRPATCRDASVASLRRFRWTGVLLCSLALLAGCREKSVSGGPEVLSGLEWTDQEGAEFSASSLAGRPFLLHFMFTSCPVACPRVAGLLKQTRQELSPQLRERVAVVSITVDPENDTASQLRAFADREGIADPAWRFLRPGTGALDALAARLTVFEPGAPRVPTAHSLTIYLFDAAGRPLQRYSAADIDAAYLASEIAALARVENSITLASSGTQQ